MPPRKLRPFVPGSGSQEERDWEEHQARVEFHSHALTVADELRALAKQQGHRSAHVLVEDYRRAAEAKNPTSKERALLSVLDAVVGRSILSNQHVHGVSLALSAVAPLERTIRSHYSALKDVAPNVAEAHEKAGRGPSKST